VNRQPDPCDELERLLALALRRLHLRAAGLAPHLPGDPDSTTKRAH